MRDAQSTAQRMETQLVQKERLFEDKIKVSQLILSRMLTIVMYKLCISSRKCNMSRKNELCIGLLGKYATM